jgi:hypothetical protein
VAVAGVPGAEDPASGGAGCECLPGALSERFRDEEVKALLKELQAKKKP